MPIKKNYQAIAIGVANGGMLTPDIPINKLRQGDFALLENWRLENASELVKVEGHDYFAPNAGQSAAPQRLGAASGVLAGREIVRPNGKAALVAVAGSKIYAFSYDSGTWSEIGTGYATSGVNWEIEEIAGYAVFNNGVDLPCTWQVGDASVLPIYELREQGYASVGTISEMNGMLLCMNILEILDAELSTILNGMTPYGAVTDPTKTQRVAFLKLWSNVNDPRDFAATVLGSVSAGSPALTINNPMASFKVGDEILVEGAGTAGGNLTTTIAAISGTSVTLADNAITSSSSRDVLKPTALSSIVGSMELEGDGAPILRGKRLKNRHVITTGTSIYVGYYTGDIAEPFVYEHIYTGKAVPRFPMSLVNVEDSYLWYVGDRHFYRFVLGSQEPTIDNVLRLAEKNLFFSRVSATDAYAVSSVIDPTVNEICLLYTYTSSGTQRRMIRRGFTDGNEYAFHVDVGFTCAFACHRPMAANAYDPKELWFIFGDSSGNITRNGRSNFEVFTQQRYGANFYATALGGLLDFGDGFNEKDVRSYVLLMSDPSGSYAMEFSLYGADNTNQTPALLETITLNNTSYPGVANLYYRKTYFQEKFRTNANAAVRVSGRIWEVAGIESKSIVRTSA